MLIISDSVIDEHRGLWKITIRPKNNLKGPFKFKKYCPKPLNKIGVEPIKKQYNDSVESLDIYYDISGLKQMTNKEEFDVIQIKNLDELVIA